LLARHANPSFEGNAEGVDRFERRDGDLDVDDRLGVEARDGSRADVVDAQRHGPELDTKLLSQSIEQGRPFGLVGNDRRCVVERHRKIVPRGGAEHVSQG
jgi:hypothetical protein